MIEEKQLDEFEVYRKRKEKLDRFAVLMVLVSPNTFTTRKT